MPRDYQRLQLRYAAYKLDRKSSGGRYYLRLFFDLMNISVVNSHAIYKVLYPKGMELLDFKIVLTKSLIGKYNSGNRNKPVSHVSRREILPASVALHLPVLETTRGKCRYCYTGGIEKKTYIQCNTCGVSLCLIYGNRSQIFPCKLCKFPYRGLKTKHFFCFYSFISSLSFTLGYLAGILFI